MNRPFIRYKNVGRTFRFLTVHAFDRRTDGFTMQRDKNVFRCLEPSRRGPPVRRSDTQTEGPLDIARSNVVRLALKIRHLNFYDGRVFLPCRVSYYRWTYVSAGLWKVPTPQSCSCS